MSFEEMMKAFLDYLRGLRRVQATLANYSVLTRDFTRYCREVQGCATPGEVEGRFLGSYVAELQERGLSRQTIYARHRGVRTWFAWAHLRGFLLTDPLKNVHLPCPPLLPRGAPTEEQVALFLNAPGPALWGQRDRCLLEFLYCTGLRVGECVALNVSDVDLEQCLLRVHNRKTSKDRFVPFGERVQQLLSDYIHQIRPNFVPRTGQEQALWLGRRGQRCRTLDIQRGMRFYSLQLGLSITPHDLRHAYATHLMLRGASVVAVQALLGHERLSTTQRYTHLLPTDLKKEMLATHPRGIRKKPRKQK